MFPARTHAGFERGASWPDVTELLQLEIGVSAFDALLRSIFILHAYLIVSGIHCRGSGMERGASAVWRPLFEARQSAADDE